MVLFGGIIVVAGFFICLKLFGVIERSRKVIEVSKSSLAVVRDSNLDDLQKEKALQKHAIELFTLFFLITAGSLAALALPFGLIWLMELAKLLDVSEVIELTLTLEFIAATIIISLGYYLVIRRIRGKS
jgi:sterol desaturase/sphingolipid hydroxylase (fatty acid hydroxylase superfamily)